MFTAMMHCNERREREQRRQNTKAQIPERVTTDRRAGVCAAFFFLCVCVIVIIFFLLQPPARITGRLRYHAEKTHAIQMNQKEKKIF